LTTSWQREAAVVQAGRRFPVRLAAMFLLVAAASAGTATARAAPASVQAAQVLAALQSAHQAYAKPTQSSKLLQVVQARRPLTNEQTVLPVLAERLASGGQRWLNVRLPGRPNGQTGWIRQRGTRAGMTRWHVVIDTATRRVTVYKNGRPLQVFRAVVGKPSTPTPLGEFFVEESIQLQSYDVGAPFALALSARSDVFQEFDGGPGQIALHGLDNVGGVLGTAASHGCVRLADASMRWLVTRVGPGVPVTIV
jgi:lipoprotein-anchoring transpeptidase ErfK/SrfK